jgi:hypothetical protein
MGVCRWATASAHLLVAGDSGTRGDGDEGCPFFQRYKPLSSDGEVEGGPTNRREQYNSAGVLISGCDWPMQRIKRLNRAAVLP